MLYLTLDLMLLDGLVMTLQQLWWLFFLPAATV